MSRIGTFTPVQSSASLSKSDGSTHALFRRRSSFEKGGPAPNMTGSAASLGSKHTSTGDVVVHDTGADHEELVIPGATIIEDDISSDDAVRPVSVCDWPQRAGWRELARQLR